MDWNRMTRRQQDAARGLATEFGVSVSQAAKHFEDAMACHKGEITRARLTEITGWKLEPTAQDLQDERARLLARVAQIDAALAAMGSVS